MSVDVAASDPWAGKGYGAGAIPPGERPAVLVVDLQRGFTEPDSLGGGPLIQRAVENTARLLAAARNAGIPVYHATSAWEGPGDLALWRFKVPGLAAITPGSAAAEVDPRLWHESDILLPSKKWPSAFHGTPLVSLLTAAQRDTVVVAGATTSGCIRATIVDAFSYGLRTLVPEDCVGDHGQDAHEANLRDVQRRYAEVTSCDELVPYLRSVAAYAAGG